MARRTPATRRPASGWSQLRAPQSALGASLARRHHLRLHGWAIGSFTLALMWSVSRLLLALGVHSLALRYLATLGVGYLAYLLVLRLWAGWLVRRPGDQRRGGGDAWLDGGWPPAEGRGGGSWDGGGGGRFAGGGASGPFESAGADALPDGLGEAAGGALDAAASEGEGALVVVPVLAIFLLGAALLAGAGALAWLYFGSEVLLAVAVELAFSLAAARAAMGAERAGWLGAAVRLTWKPLLAAVASAAVLGGALQHFVPEAQTLVQALRLLRAR